GSNRRFNQFTIPDCWLGAIFIWAGSLIFRISAKRRWRNIKRPCKRVIPSRTLKPQPSEDLPARISHAARVKLKGRMKQPSLIFILMLVLAAGGAAQQQPSSGSASQTVKSPPQAKTTAEYKDYNTAYATSGGSQMEAAANAFAAKYPDSELRVYLYNKAMHEYQTENN